jgi:hypothetical protein
MVGAFYNAKKGKDFSNKFDLIVVRVSAHGDLCNSRPCFNCLEMMRAVNIKRVFYVDNKSNIVCENVRDMISMQASVVTRLIYTIKKNIEQNTDSSKNIFFKELLRKIFPSKVKRYNFETFINHDLKHSLPDHSYIIRTEKSTNIVIIMDGNNREILKATMVD